MKDEQKTTTDKCSVTTRTALAVKMFGDSGLIHADDCCIWTHHGRADHWLWFSVSILGTTCPVSHGTCIAAVRVPPTPTALVVRWTNNTRESVNNLLKLSIDWRRRCLPELVDRLYSVVQVHMKDLQRALCSHGNYTPGLWSSKPSLCHTLSGSWRARRRMKHSMSSWLTQWEQTVQRQ